MAIFTIIGILVVAIVAVALVSAYWRGRREIRAAESLLWMDGPDEADQRSTFRRVVTDWVSLHGRPSSWDEKKLLGALVGSLGQDIWSRSGSGAISQADLWMAMRGAFLSGPRLNDTSEANASAQIELAMLTFVTQRGGLRRVDISSLLVGSDQMGVAAAEELSVVQTLALVTVIACHQASHGPPLNRPTLRGFARCIKLSPNGFADLVVDGFLLPQETLSILSLAVDGAKDENPQLGPTKFEPNERAKRLNALMGTGIDRQRRSESWFRPG